MVSVTHLLVYRDARQRNTSAVIWKGSKVRGSFSPRANDGGEICKLAKKDQGQAKRPGDECGNSPAWF